MGVFILLILFVFILSQALSASGRMSKYKYTKYLLICFSALVLLRVCVRWKEWGDLPEYYDAFALAARQSLKYFTATGWTIANFRFEPGWVFYNWLLSHLWFDFYFFLFVTALITLAGYYYVVKKFAVGDMAWLPVLLIIFVPYLQSFYVLRQHMAMGIILFSYPLIIEKKLIKYLVVVICAYLIHQTALFTLPLYFMYNIQSRKKVIMILALYLIIMFSSIIIISNYFILDWGLGAQKYLNVDEETASNWKVAFLMLGLLSFRLLVLRDLFFEEGVTKLMSLILIIGCMNAMAGASQTAFMSRLNMYFSASFFLLVPNTLMYVKNKQSRFLYGFLLALFFGGVFFMRYSAYSTGTFIWDL